MVTFTGIGVETPARQQPNNNNNNIDDNDPASFMNTRQSYPTTPLPIHRPAVIQDVNEDNDIMDEDDDEFMPPASNQLEDYQQNSSFLSPKNGRIVVNDDEDGDVSTSFVTCAPTHMQQDPYECWVVVYGFQQEDAQAVLYQFTSYGTIVRQTSGIRTGNFMCLKYITRMQAVKALCQSGTFLSGSRDLIGVRKVDARFASEIGLLINDDDSAGDALPPVGINGMKKTELKDESSIKSPATESGLTADDIMITRKIEPNLTYRVLAWLFNW